MCNYRKDVPKRFRYESKDGTYKGEMELVFNGREWEHILKAHVTRIRPEMVDSSKTTHTSVGKNRELIEAKIGSDGTLLEDTRWKYSGTALGVVVGRAMHGQKEWKDKNGRCLGDWEIKKGTPKQPRQPKQQNNSPKLSSGKRNGGRKIPSLSTDPKVRLLRDHGPGCQACGTVFSNPAYLQVDHISPKSCGGSDSMDNRVLLCGPCNGIKGDRLTIPETRRELSRRGMPFIIGNVLKEFHGLEPDI